MYHSYEITQLQNVVDQEQSPSNINLPVSTYSGIGCNPLEVIFQVHEMIYARVKQVNRVIICMECCQKWNKQCGVKQAKRICSQKNKRDGNSRQAKRAWMHGLWTMQSNKKKSSVLSYWIRRGIYILLGVKTPLQSLASTRTYIICQHTRQNARWSY